MDQDNLNPTAFVNAEDFLRWWGLNWHTLTEGDVRTVLSGLPQAQQERVGDAVQMLLRLLR